MKLKEKNRTEQLLSPGKLRLFRTFIILLPMVFFLVIELSLRIFNYGFSSTPLIKSKTEPQFLTVNPDLGQRYFPTSQMQPDVSTDFILAEKPDTTFRIFVLGGSSAAGYPYGNNGSFSTMLRVLLENAYPKTHFEMINLAMTAVNSHTVLDIVNRLWQYDPDLILIYSGHNEFYGALGVGSMEYLGTSRGFIKFYLGISQFKIFQLVRNSLGLLRSVFSDISQDRGTLMERIVKEKEIRYRGPMYREALKNYRENLIEIYLSCKEHDIPLILSTLVSNVHDQKPFVDQFKSAALKEEWKKVHKLAKEAFADNDLSNSIHHINEYLDMDSIPASPYYIIASLQEMMGDSLASYENFYRAKDHDALRFRASEDFNYIIWELNQKFQVPVADVKYKFESQSLYRIPGEDLLLEHLHPNLEGYYLMAKTFYYKILDLDLLRNKRKPIISDEILWSKLGITQLDKEIGNIRIQILTNGWPFKKGKVGQISDLKYQANTSVQQFALKYWKKEISWEKAHVKLAEYYEQNQQLDMAENEYRALIVGTPMNPSPFHRLAVLLITQNKFEEAIPILKKLIRLEDNFFAIKMLGAIYIKKNMIDDGLVYLEKAYHLNKTDAQNLYNLSGVYLLTDQLSKAKKTAEELSYIDPDFPGFQKLWQQIEKLGKKN